MHGKVLLTAVIVMFLTLSSETQASPGERRATIFYTAEAHGVLEPCGCTSDPLGDFARVSGLVRATAGAKKSAVIVDAGNLGYGPAPASARKQPAARLRAEFLGRELARLPFAGAGVGQTDVGRGPVVPKRLAVNLTGNAGDIVEPSRLEVVGGIKLGVLGVIDPDVARAAGLQAAAPGPAAATEVQRLRAAGAEVVVLLAPVERTMARALARESGADFVIVGQNVGSGMRRAEPAGRGFVVAPGDELQYLGRLDIVLRGTEPRTAETHLEDGGGAEQAQERAADLDARLARLEADLARWQKDAGADSSFVAGKLRQRDELRAERDGLRARWQPPRTGSYFTNRLIPVRRSLPRDPALAASLRKLDQAVGAANLAAAEPPPPPEPGRAYFVGDGKCVSCHKSAARAWARSRHAHAWKTLVDVGKEAHDECVSCHVTGYGEVGGSSVGYTKGLENVQCETCHQPNSIHVEKRGKESPYAGSLRTPEAVCVRCHNEKHSDTFKYEPYLRDALGPGHGEDLLDKLGPGPTARDLRRAAERAARAKR